MSMRIVTRKTKFHFFECTKMFFDMVVQGLDDESTFNLNRFKALYVTMKYMCFITNISSEEIDLLAEEIFGMYESNNK